jgi:hypothetical protein
VVLSERKEAFIVPKSVISIEADCGQNVRHIAAVSFSGLRLFSKGDFTLYRQDDIPMNM